MVETVSFGAFAVTFLLVGALVLALYVGGKQDEQDALADED